MKEYIKIVDSVLKYGTLKKNRTGVDTISLFDEYFKYDMRNGFPLLTTKKIKWENIVLELLWFLSGTRSDEFFKKHGITFWDSWKNDKGELPQAYGEFWRKYPAGLKWNVKYNICEQPEDSGWMGYYDHETFDQIAAIINELKTNINSRRLVIDRWNAPISWKESLPPCALLSIFNVQYEGDKPILNLHTTMRSVDTMVGLPFNIAGFGLLLALIGHLTNIEVGILSFSLVDCHIYVPHIEQAKMQCTRGFMELPTLKICTSIKSLDDIELLINNGTKEEIMSKFNMEGYSSHPFIKFDVAV